MLEIFNIKRVVASIIPSRVLATFFWIGYLPEWQNHWTAFFTIPLVLLVLYFSVGFSVYAVVWAQVLLLLSLFILLVGLVGIYLFQKTVFSENRYEVTVHVAFGQCLMLALSVPAINQTLIQVFSFDSFVCAHFLNCADWFLKYSTYFVTGLVPYFIYRLVDIIKPWPSYWIERDYHNALSNMLEGFFNAVYASMIFYMLNFMLFNLLLIDVVEFYKQVFSGIFLGGKIHWVQL